jgi:hypothetical protein
VSSNYVPNLGELCGDDARRDAVHIAVAPVVAWHDLQPGSRVALRDDGAAYYNYAFPIGIVDPFLTHDVEAGQRFWLYLLPNTITGLRHVWSHPAFKPKAPRE